MKTPFRLFLRPFRVHILVQKPSGAFRQVGIFGSAVILDVENDVETDSVDEPERPSAIAKSATMIASTSCGVMASSRDR